MLISVFKEIFGAHPIFSKSQNIKYINLKTGNRRFYSKLYNKINIKNLFYLLISFSNFIFEFYFLILFSNFIY